MHNPAFFGEPAPSAMFQPVSDCIEVFARNRLSLDAIFQTLRNLEELYRTEEEIGLPAEQYMPMNEDRN